MLAYSLPLLVLGLAGILNQVADKIIFPFVYPDEAEATVQLGIYGAASKIAMVMAMLTQLPLCIRAFCLRKEPGQRQ